MKIVLILILLLGINFAEQSLVVDFTIDKNDNMKTIKLYVVNGSETWCGTEGPYSIQLLDKHGSVKRSRNFSIGFILYTDPPRPLTEDGITCDLAVDIDDVAFLLIKHNDRTIYSENIVGKFCNHDMKCNNYENIFSCPSDCTAASADGYCTSESDGICDPDCPAIYDSDCPIDKKCIDDVCYTPLDLVKPFSNTVKLFNKYRSIIGGVICGIVLLLLTALLLLSYFILKKK